MRRTIQAIALVALLASSLANAAPIPNTARVTYLSSVGAPVEQLSNTVTLDTLPGPSPGAVSFHQFAPGAPSALPTPADGALCGNGAGGFYPSGPLTTVSGTPIDLTPPAPLLATGFYHAGEPVFLFVTDANRNADSGIRETIDVNVTTSDGDDETVRLLETGPDTGFFAGGIQSAGVLPPAASFDCRLSLTENATLTANYVDASDPTDTSTAQALVDPFGFAFDSVTGALIDGASVTLIDIGTGMPAVVFGDDGTSSFPATITTGGSATDSAGRTYVFPPGGFRYPFVPSGNYRFEVAPPPGFSAPSTRDPNLVRNVLGPTGSPYVVTTGSFGDVFAVIPGPSLRIDVPLDGEGSNALVLEKQASRQQATAGDFVQYVLTLRNATLAPVTGVQITDVLPLGFRYRSGSTHYDGVRVGDPAITSDGRTLAFTVGTIAAGASLTITYVVEVTSGAPDGEAINTAFGSADGGLTFNQAQASIRIRDAFFGSCAVLIGRVVEGECATPQEELKGVGNVRILLDDGTYNSTDPNGQFHFEKVCKGTHVVQLDLESLPPDMETIPCIQNTRFAGRSFSQFVDVQGGTMWRTDFYVRHKPPADGPVGIRLQSIDPPSADLLSFRVEVDGGRVPLRNLRVTALLPDGVTYVPGSARSDGGAIEDPQIDATALTFRLGDLGDLGEPGANWKREIEFSARPAAPAAPGEHRVAKALAAFESGLGPDRTPTVEVDLGAAASPPEPVPAAATPVPVVVRADSGRQQTRARAEGAPHAQPVSEATSPEREIPDDATAAGGKTDWMEQALRAPGTGWLFPPEHHNPRAPTLRIVIRHEPAQQIVLAVNGAIVDPLTFDGTETSADGSVAVSVWRGIPLQEGENQLVAEVMNSDGSMAQTLSREVHFSNAPAKAEIVPEESVLFADGIARPVIAVRFLDRDGYPVRAGVTGPFILGAPYVSQQEIDRQQHRQLAGLDDFQPVYTVEGDEGIAYIELQPTTVSGQVVLDLAFQSDQQIERNVRRQQLRTWLEATQRDWVIVGFAEGSLGYETLSGNMQSLAASDAEGEGVVTDGQASFYAKGRVLGQWLLTLAYETDQSEESPHRESLMQVIDPDEFYLLYGDGTDQRYDAPSQRKLYLKLERAQFYAMFGDYDTGLTQTELMRYSRSLNGFKSEYGGEKYQYNVFASDTSQRFARDEIQGNGTSGLYRLSGQHIVINSEKIALETRDRFKSQDIIENRVLLRHIDYDIDYTNGTLFFRQPIFSRDTALNPIFIVADYEVEGGGSKELNAGGRVATTLFDGRVTAGVSVIRDAELFGHTDLEGADLKVKLLPDTELRVEVAGSQGELGGIDQDGSAYLAEIDHYGSLFDSVAYVRRQEPEFGVGQQFSAENGQEKVGLLGRVPLGDKTSIYGEAYHQENLRSEATRLASILRLERRFDKGTVFGGAQYARDENDLGDTFESQQIVLGANHKFFADRLDLLGQAEVSIAGKDESLDFPSRYLAQAGYDVTKEVKLIVAEEITQGEAFNSQTTRAGAIVNPWKGARLNTTLNQDFGEFGPRTFALFGLTQSILIGKNWGIDLGVDQSSTLAESHSSNAPLIEPNYPIAAGSGAPKLSPTGTPGVFGISTEDFTAVSTGVTYRADLWSANARGEFREGETDDRWGVITNFLREARAGVAFASSGRVFSAKRQSGTEGVYASVDLSWAYRPLGSHWSLLDRLEFRLDQLDNGTGVPGSGLFGSNSLTTPGDAISRAVVNNFNLNRTSHAWTQKDREGNLFDLNQRNQWSLYYGSKYSFDEYDGIEYTGYTDLIGAEWRFDVKTWLDVGVQGSVLHSWDPDNYQFSAGPSVGFSPITNSWISIGYNVIGFRDRDFDAAKYTAQGVIIKLRIKFDQLTRLPGHDREDPRAVSTKDWLTRLLEDR